jgi:hypothetical protein
VDDNTRLVLIALLGPLTGLIVGIVVAKIGQAETRAMQDARWAREDRAGRNEALLKSLADTYAEVELELSYALALAVGDELKAERFELQREARPYPDNDLGLLGPDAKVMWDGIFQLVRTPNAATAIALRQNLRQLAWMRIQRQREMVGQGSDPETATQENWEQARAEYLAAIEKPR